MPPPRRSRRGPFRSTARAGSDTASGYPHAAQVLARLEPGRGAVAGGGGFRITPAIPGAAPLGFGHGLELFMRRAPQQHDRRRAATRARSPSISGHRRRPDVGHPRKAAEKRWLMVDSEVVPRTHSGTIQPRLLKPLEQHL